MTVPPDDFIPDEPRLDVDRATIRRILAEPIDPAVEDELEAAEEPVDEIR